MRIIDQNPELNIKPEDSTKMSPKFKTGPRDKD